jgi:hypothetical protein
MKLSKYFKWFFNIQLHQLNYHFSGNRVCCTLHFLWKKVSPCVIILIILTVLCTLDTFKSLYMLVYENFIMICLDLIFFVFLFLELYSASCSHWFILFIKHDNLSAVISSNILSPTHFPPNNSYFYICIYIYIYAHTYTCARLILSRATQLFLCMLF